MAAPLIVLLHGVNADGENLAPLRDFLRDRLPGTVVVAPDAPFATPIGYQWFSLDGVTRDNIGARVLLARLPFDELLKSILAAHGAGDLRRVALLGFSQGGMMALDALVDGRWPVAAVAAFSTRLASPPPFPKPARAPVLLVHGDDDSVIPSAAAREAQATLRELGLAVDTHILPGVDHCITAEGMELAAEFFARTLPAAIA
jgi:phospholipase/carboxylesterase